MHTEPFKTREADKLWEAWFARNLGRGPDEIKLARAIVHLMESEFADIATSHAMDILEKTLRVARLTETTTRNLKVRDWRRGLDRHSSRTAAVQFHTAHAIYESLCR